MKVVELSDIIWSTEFLRALLASPTFYQTIVLYGLIFVLLTVCAGWVILSKKTILARLHRDTRGAAAAVDFVLTIPIFMTVILLIVQLAMIVNTSLIVHYAAYAAARSARVWAWDMDVWTERLIKSGGSSIGGLSRLEALGRFAAYKGRAQRHAQSAARFVLIAASPGDRRVPANATEIPEETLSELADAGQVKDRAEVLSQQARYAFDPENSTVTISQPTNLKGISSARYVLDWAQPGNAWPLKASVEYRMHLGVPIASRVFGDKVNGHYYKKLQAEIVLL